MLQRKSTDWAVIAMVNNTLGNIYRALSGEHSGERQAAELALAQGAYTEAWEATPPDHASRLGFAIDLAEMLRDLPTRSAEQLELLIAVQTEIRDRRRGEDDPGWPVSADLLGDAYRERAESRSDPAAREEDLALALAAYTEAWDASSRRHDNLLDLAIDLADALMRLAARSAEQLELLIAVQTEIRDRRRAAGDPGWPVSADLLGRAHRERAESNADPAAREEDLALALAAYTQAWDTTPADHDNRLDFAIHLASGLMRLAARSPEQLELLIAVQTEIRDRRRGAGNPAWPEAADLLGMAYQERAESRSDPAAREEDLALAVAAYTQAWEATPPDHDNRLRFAIDLANALVVQAAIRPVRRMDGRAVVDHALDLVASAITDRELDRLSELRRLLPVLSVQLVRRQWSLI